MTDYNINGTIFYNVALGQKSGGPRARTPVAEAWLKLVDPPKELQSTDARRHLIWRERLKNSRTLARSGVVHAMAIQPGRVAARVEDPLSHKMHTIKISASALAETAWANLAAQADYDLQVAAHIASGVLPDSVISGIALTQRDISFEADGALVQLNHEPDPLLMTAWIVFGERIDLDPWLWVLFRGQTQDGLLELIRQHARERAASEAAVVAHSPGATFALDRFWMLGNLATGDDSHQPGQPRILTQLRESKIDVLIGKRTLAKVLAQALQV